MGASMVWFTMFACGVEQPAPSSEPDTDTDADSDADTDVDADTDADTDTDPEPAVIVVSNVTTRLHPDFETVGYVAWTQDVAGTVSVELSVAGGPWEPAPPTAGEAGANEQIVLGMPYDSEVDWRLSVGSAVVTTGTLRTGPTPRTLPAVRFVSGDDTRWDSGGKYLLTSVNTETGGWTGGPFWTVLLDRQGRVVWARLSRDWTLFAQVSTSDRSTLLIDDDTTWSEFDRGAGSRVVRMTLEGVIDTIDTPGLQHAFVEHTDGTLAWGSLQHGPSESLVELAPGAADPTIVFTCGEDWPGADDNCESNGLFYDPVRDEYLYSFWTNHSVVAVDRTRGTPNWWAGTVPGGYDFVPRNSSFWLQHGVSYTPTGTFLLSSEEDGPTTFVREYEVDHAAGQLLDVWSFDAGVHAVTNGDAWRLPGGNTLHVVGSAGVVKEAAPDGSVVWELTWDSERLLGRGEFVADLYSLLGR